MELSWPMVIFGGFAAISVAAGIALALSKRFVFAAFLLFTLLFSLAGIFIFAGAEMLAIAQIIVYVGGILILLVFGMMLTRKRLSGHAETALHQTIPAAILSLCIAGIFLYILLPVDWEGLSWISNASAVEETGLNNPQLIGKQLLTSYMLPFELMGILLLLALVGAATVARKGS